MRVLKEQSFKVRAPGTLVVVLKKAAHAHGWNLSEQIRYDLMVQHGLVKPAKGGKAVA